MKNLVPKRRFEEFKDSDPWEQRKLGDIGDTFTGLSGKTKDDFGKGEAEFVTYLNVFNNAISNTDVTEKVGLDNRQNEVKYGDIFFTTSSETPEEVGMSSVWLGNRENVYLNSFCFGYRLKIEMDPFYIAYSLRANPIREQFILLAQGISRYNISKTKAMDIKISLPKLEEQVRIGKFFKQLDNLITLHQRKLDKLKETKSAYLSEMFPKEGELYPKRRFAGFTDPWEQRKLEELDFIISDGNYGELYPKANELLSEGVPFIRVNNLVDGYLVHKDLVYISEKQHSVLTSGHLKANDILITTRGEIGKIALVDSSFENANINAQICLIRTQENMASKYLHQYLQTNLSQMEITSFQTGSALKQLPKKRLGDITINYPSLMEEQIQIGNFFTNLDNLITLHQRKLDKLQALKQAYLSEMFV